MPGRGLPIPRTSLYTISKDNGLLVRRDLRELTRDPEAGVPPSDVLLRDELYLSNDERLTFRGHSALVEKAATAGEIRPFIEREAGASRSTCPIASHSAGASSPACRSPHTATRSARRT